MKKTMEVRKSYLVKFLNPEQEYSVSYDIDNKGNRIDKPTVRLGKDLTENMIVELFEKELL